MADEQKEKIKVASPVVLTTNRTKTPGGANAVEKVNKLKLIREQNNYYNGYG